MSPSTWSAAGFSRLLTSSLLFGTYAAAAALAAYAPLPPDVAQQIRSFNPLLIAFALATLIRKLGRAAESRKHLKNASALIAACDPEALVPGSDGLTARRIAAFVQAFDAPNT